MKCSRLYPRARRYTIPTILMHRQSLRHTARIFHLVIANPRERERRQREKSRLPFPLHLYSLMWRVRPFSFFQSITIRDNVRRNDAFNAKTITIYCCDVDAFRVPTRFELPNSIKKLIDLILSFISDISRRVCPFYEGAFFRTRSPDTKRPPS